MERDKTDQVFNAITSNGCREMDEERFHQAVNECLDVQQSEINRLKEDKKQIIALIKTELENDIKNDFSTAYYDGLEKALDIILSQNKH